MQQGKNKVIGIVAVAIGFAAVAVFFCMASTLNPWSQKLPHLDSAVWLRCAVEMKQGKVIYRDVWDHKGAILFAIQFLGLTLTPHSLNIYFGFNYDYVSGVDFASLKSSVLNFTFKDNWFVISHMILFFLLLHDRKLDWKWSAFLYSMISIMCVSVSGRGYVHYGLQMVPCMIIPITVCINRIKEWCHSYKEFVMIAAVVGVLCIRFEVQRYQELIAWTVSTEGDNYSAGGNLENYLIVNEWIGRRWSDEALDKWVANDNLD